MPYTISSSGNYRIVGTGTWTAGSGTALTIDADNVVVDGQNILISASILDNAVVEIAVDRSNVTLEKLNIQNGFNGIVANDASNITIVNSTLTRNYFGVYSERSSNLTILNSLINRNNLFGVYLVEANNFEANNLTLNNNIIVAFAASSSNFTFTNSTLNNNAGAMTISLSNFTITNSNLDGNSAGIITDESNYAIINSTMSGNNVGIYSTNSNYLLVQNSNITNTPYAAGIAADSSSNITIQNSNLTGNNHGLNVGDSNNIAIVNSTLSGNDYNGLYAENSGNFTIAGSILSGNGWDGVNATSSSNFTIMNSTMNNNYWCGVEVEDSGNFTIIDSVFNDNEQRSGVYSISSSFFTILNSTLNNNGWDGVTTYESSGNFTITTSTLNDNYDYGVFTDSSGNFTITNSNLNNNWCGLCLIDSGNFTVTNSTLNHNYDDGVYSENLGNFTIVNSIISDNDAFGFFLVDSNNLTITNTTINNNVFGGLTTIDSNITLCSSRLMNNNLVDYSAGAVAIEDTNANSNNIYVYGNIFENNAFTLSLSTDNTNNFNDQLFFFNNYINDTTYIHPDSTSTSTIDSILHFNTTIQPGVRVYGAGSMIGGNYWAYPDGTGPSQIGADADQDGFIDTPFDVFGNNTFFDYHPYSTENALHLVFIDGESQTLAANQLSTAIIIELHDSLGAVTTGFTVNLASNSTTGTFYSDAAGTNQIISLTVLPGSSQAIVYYKDTTVGTPEITITAEDATPISTQFTINPAAIDHLILSPSESAITAGNTQAFTATAYDAYDNTWDVTDVVVWSINSTAGGSWSNNIYTAEKTGNWIVTATVSSTVSTASLIVNTAPLDHLTISPVGATITAGDSQVYTVDSYDQYGNLIASNVAASFKVNGTDYSGNEINITVAGVYTIEATYNSKTVTATLTVTPAAVDHFAVSVPDSANVDSAFNITVTAKDAYGNTVVGFTGTANLTTSQGTISPAVSGSFVDGVWTGQVTLNTTGSIIINVSAGSNTGSSTVAINTPATPTPASTPASGDPLGTWVIVVIVVIIIGAAVIGIWRFVLKR
ncbi:MAG: right-handed parallel beta-helix repeat-containing protein [Candidatus Bathyarchaeota archaeon]|nr:right-handed parallel beta-helix repeat-containing protein [Candidatus Bathyarchaeota archaeon]